ncbi:BspA family leucine-rich repeat surface protein [Enterococcus faecalis]|uniref:BspA family leucine-rich repeat surface protein n=1 Tax=Enterococcus faecalis TaxID=1351 RepID=UPI0025B19C46|nr:BspA family leucine-rich repeat surface protein [Enterococcus faecalis]MDN3128795.1 BspA family leucine-rich repeat surface protein [Enterococcus faecalis]
MKRKKYAYLFATTVLLANVATTPLTVIAETMQENSSSEVAEKAEKQEKNQEEPSNSAEVKQAQEVPATNDEKIEEGQAKEETPIAPEETPVVENEEEAPEGATNAEVETDAGTTTNQEVRLADWETEDKGSYVLITKYTGSSTEIVVPNEIDGKPTKLKDIDSTVFPNISSVTSFAVLPKEDGTKVGVESTDLSRAFQYKSGMKKVDLSGLDTSNVTDMSSMFAYANKVEEINLKGLDTSNVTDMSEMFYNAGNYGKILTSIDVSSFDTSKVTNMKFMFARESSNKLKNLDVRHFNTSKVTDMSYMFAGYGGETLDVSNFDTSKVTNMQFMFYYASNLKSLNLSHFNTSQVTSMRCMFEYCKKISNLDLSNFDTSRVRDMSEMFKDTFSRNDFQETSKLDLRNFVINETTNISNMFKQHYSYKNRSAVILATDSKLLDYNYDSDLVVPVVMPQLNANGGQFKDQTNTKQYFTKVAYTPEEFEKMNKLTAFEQFQKDNVPTKAGTTFLGWKLTEGNDSGAQNVYPDLYGAKYKALWAENMGAPVTVKYVFEETGKEIASSQTIEGEVGESYDATTPEYKLNIDGYVLDESRLPDNAKGTFSKEAKEVVYYYKAAPLSLVNGSFEDPVISSPNLSPLGYYWQGYTSIPGWKTTGSHIELQKAGPNFKIPAVDGNQWAEINYDRNAALYQDIKTTPGDTLYWEVYHRGTDGTDTAAVEIGKPDGQLVEEQQMKTEKTAWKKYSGFYTVPEGQTTTRFQIRTLAVGSAYPSYGNSLDHVVFTNITSKITVNFVDENGKPIKEPQTIKGYKDQAYDLTDIVETPIPGYKLDESKIPEGIKGTFTEEAKKITLTYKPLDIHIPSEGEDNTKPGEISSYGIAYMPKQFQTNSTVLNDAGPQSILVNKTDRFDVGVRDLRNAASQWTLSAQLVWNKGKELSGSSIKTTNKTGVVMKNINNGIDPFNPATDLTDSNNEVQGGSNITITDVPTPIMTANNVSHNAVYNYNLGEVSLEIPEARTVQPGSYVGHVEWNLANTL